MVGWRRWKDRYTWRSTSKADTSGGKGHGSPLVFRSVTVFRYLPLILRAYRGLKSCPIDDHRSLPGITLGDIGTAAACDSSMSPVSDAYKTGPKAMNGAAAIDNGFVRFDHVQIPAENMLSKFAQVTEDGRYVQPPHAKISYGGVRLFTLSILDITTIYLSVDVIHQILVSLSW